MKRTQRKKLKKTPTTGLRALSQHRNVELESICERLLQMGFKKTFISAYRKERLYSDFQEELDEYWIKCLMMQQYNHKTKEESLERIIYDIGLKKKVAANLWKKVIQPIFDTCYNEEQLFDIAIEHLLNDSISEYSNNSYYFDLPEHNKWFYNPDIHEGFMINYDDRVSISEIISSLEKIDSVKQKNDFYLFHCTNWNSANNIINSGVDHRKGRMCLDFGIRSGFYLTKDIIMAKAWGNKRKDDWKNKIAIVIFRMNPKKIMSLRFKNFRNADDEWERLVNSSRQCKEKKNELDSFDFVRGPICKNPRLIVKENAKPIASNTLFQYASKTDKADESLQENFVGCIWIKKES